MEREMLSLKQPLFFRPRFNGPLGPCRALPRDPQMKIEVIRASYAAYPLNV
jgi:hypothetical protein